MKTVARLRCVGEHAFPAPHGGLKQSGYGKGMSSSALEDYTVVRHGMIRHQGAGAKSWGWPFRGRCKPVNLSRALSLAPSGRACIDAKVFGQNSADAEC